MSWHLGHVDTAAVAALAGVAAAALVPELVRHLPEPTPPDEDISVADDQGDTVVPPAGIPAPDPVEAKQPYAVIAALPGLRWKAALAGGVAGGLLGARLGWSGALLVTFALVPLGVALAVVDWRTRLLPTRLVAPAYVVVLALLPVAALVDGEARGLWRAGWGWVAFGGLFLLLWLVYPAGMGYGDVRLSGVLGLALGYVGWGALVVGVLAAFTLGAVGGLLLSALRVVDRRSYPFGPFLLAGALVGVLLGAPAADWYLATP
jgi:leader peptidase (prepilin peptidase)/N-methyltransferase